MARAKKAIGGPKIVDPAPKKKTKKAIAGHTGGGMKLPERKPRGKRPTPRVSDTGGGLRRPKIKRPTPRPMAGRSSRGRRGLARGRR